MGFFYQLPELYITDVRKNMSFSRRSVSIPTQILETEVTNWMVSRKKVVMHSTLTSYKLLLRNK